LSIDQFMRGWDLQIRLDGGGPVFLRIARALADDVRAGRLPPGTRLPGSRVLARSLGVHRNTVRKEKSGSTRPPAGACIIR
jgi:GntR family transcriptional regulator/MocR family aminotransferase